MSKLKTRLVGLQKLKFIVPYESRKKITMGIFNSVLVYCLPLFGGLNKGEVHELQVLQNKAAQIVTHKSPYTPRKVLYDQLGWLTVSQLIVYHCLLLIFKIRQSGEPEYLASYLNNDSRTGRIMVTNCKLSLTLKIFCFRDPSDWNSLPQNARNSSKIGEFKREAKKWVLQNISRFSE